MKEIWKDIKNYENSYQISTYGRIKSKERIIKNGKHSNRISKEKIKASNNSTTGYKIVMLYKNSKYKNYKIHRLVASHFIPNNKNKPEVNHIDGNKMNNNVSNLEWCTHRENAIHSINVLGNKCLRGEECSYSIFKNKDIIDIRGLHKIGWNNTEISRIYECGVNTIRAIVTRKTWKHIDTMSIDEVERLKR